METTFSPFAMTTLARPVHGILLARVPRSEVEDLVQEVFLLEALERLLSPLGTKPDTRFVFPQRRTWIPPAIAASLLVVLGGIWLALNRNHSAWQVSALAGAPQVSRLERGEWLTTDAGSRAKLEIASVGEVEVEPNSQLSVVTRGKTEQRLNLKRGRISATIWAPPGQFFVNTPSAVTVDLGCAYLVEVDGSGAGLAKVPAFPTTKMQRRRCGTL